MITNGEFVSRVVNGIHALDKDSHVSRRWILNIGRTKAESYTAQRWDDGTLLGDHRLLTYVTCLEMIEVDKIVCCDAEFAIRLYFSELKKYSVIYVSHLSNSRSKGRIKKSWKLML